MNEFALNGTVLKNREKFDSVNSNNSHIDTFSAESFARNEEFKWFWFVCKIISLSRMDKTSLRGVLM